MPVTPTRVEINHETSRVRITPAPGADISDRIRPIPGAVWDSRNPAWEAHPTHRTAVALRKALTGIPVAITNDAATILKNAADTPPPPDITLGNPHHETGQPHEILITFEHTKERQEDAKTLLAASWDGTRQAWVTTIEQLANLADYARRHGLTISPEITTLSQAAAEPFDYDGTIDGLRGIPINELSVVRAKPRRGKTPSLEERFKEYGIETIYDLLTVVPFRYQDRSNPTPIRDLTVGEQSGFIAEVLRIDPYNRANRMSKIIVGDGTGTLTITFFNMPWATRRFRSGQEVVVYGKVDVWRNPRTGRGETQMTNPIIDPTGDATTMIVPVYPQSAKSKVTTWDLHSAAIEATSRLGDLTDPIPEATLQRHDLPTRLEAYTQVHNPTTVAHARNARQRLAFDELLRMQLALGVRRHHASTQAGIIHQPTGALTSRYLDLLPYELTGAQKRVIEEIDTDLRRSTPMSRLLQGDVGVGKTQAAINALLKGVEGGYQTALMAPTEILATQLHFEIAENLTNLTHPDGRPVTVEFLGGKTRAKEKRRIYADLAAGETDIVVGTHALLVDEVEFANLGVVVVDEQHRFGVEQRAKLRDKRADGKTPDMLFMTATPIPRTAALTVYGDLAVSVLDELPPGRTPIETTWVNHQPDMAVLHGDPWNTVREQVDQGRQAYVVASLVEDNEKIAAQSAETAMEELQAGALNGLRLGLVHGKQNREDREKIMTDFKNGDLDVLVATTVIEVGVNVPNATVMVVLNAPRFGIAQLHQIRGRVGRGKHASMCILTGEAKTSDAVERMEALVASTDGFYLSEVDLKLRGEGSLFGARQSGDNDLRVASLRDDRELIVTARAEADLILDKDPTLGRRAMLRNEVTSALGEGAEEWLAKT